MCVFCFVFCLGWKKIFIKPLLLSYCIISSHYSLCWCFGCWCLLFKKSTIYENEVEKTRQKNHREENRFTSHATPPPPKGGARRSSRGSFARRLLSVMFFFFFVVVVVYVVVVALFCGRRSVRIIIIIIDASQHENAGVLHAGVLREERRRREF